MKSNPTSWLMLFLLGALLVSSVNPAQAQTEAPAWAQPVNLSASGGTENPQIVTAADGKAHVFWEDVYANMVYTSGDGHQWEAPTAVELPFFHSKTQLLADSSGLIYAFWLTDLNSLHYSYAAADSAGLEAAWAPDVELGTDIIAFKATLDSADQLHLAYILALETVNAQAGLYYTQTLTGSQAWSTPVLIYASRYYRTLLPPPGSFTPQSSSPGSALQIDVSAAVVAGQTQIFVGWDDSAIKRNFFARSFDGGTTWSAPIDLDTPETLSSYQTPRNVHINASADGVLFIWDRSDLNGENCTQHYRYSTSGGESWSIDGDLWQEFGTCPTQMTFVDGGADRWVVTAIIKEQVYLLSWNGKLWSDAQAQTDLLSFENPATLELVDYSCQNVALLDQQLVMVGCDSSEGGDIWATTRSISDVSQWYVQQAGWSNLQSLEVGFLPVQSLQLVSDPSEDVFLYWTGEKANSVSAEWGIQAAELVTGGLNGPFEVQNVNQGVPQGLAALYLPGFERLVSAWQAGENGELFAAWGNPQQAINDAGWSDAKLINPAVPYGSQPALTLTPDGMVHLFYSIPYNEQRGVYQTTSVDGGATWSLPQPLVDSAQLDCPAFQSVQAAQQAGTNFSILFTCATLPEGAGPMDLYSLDSQDGGQTWSAPTLVADEAVFWSRVLAAGEQRFYRLWQVGSGSSAKMWFSVSQDNGITWSSPNNFYSSTAAVLFVDAVSAGSGEVFFVIGSQTTEQDAPRLEVMTWNGSVWDRGQALTIGKRHANQLTALSATLVGTRAIGVALAGSLQTSMQTAPLSKVLYSELPVEISALDPIAIQVPTSQPTITVAPAVNQLEDVAPASTPEFSRQPASSLPTWSGIAAGGGLALVLVVGMVVYTRVIKKKEDE